MFAKLFTDGTEDIESYNRLFSFFERIWGQTWSELGVDGHHMYDDFFRFDKKIGFFIDRNPVAFHGYQIFDLSSLSDQKHSYFRKLPEQTIAMLKERNVRKIATLEYMAVDPRFRKLSGANVGEILGGFSTQFFLDEPVDGVLGVTRNDRGIQNMCLKYGAEPLFENVKLNNVEIDVMYFALEKIKKNENSVIQAMIRELLENVKPKILEIGVAA